MIKILDKATTDKIAAGEVVDRPVSAVKELIENSIDALSGSITVEIEKGGKSYIRVTDNGNGIPADEIETAFLRHATSKISKIEDLDFIDTLGFRGEALPSIAAVSRVELISKTRDSETGRRVVVEGGKIIDNGPVGCENGTTIIIRDLFYNTPARLKFMKSDNAESRQIIELVSQLAIAYPNIRFRLINNKNVLFSTRGTSKREDAILTIYGKVTGKDLIFFNSGTSFMEIEGHVSDPSVTFPTRKQQIFFVNGRVIESPVISKAVAKAYEERLFKGRFPVSFIFILIDPSRIDVNVHPNKREIKFHDEQQVGEFIQDSIRKALLSKESIPQVREKDIFTKKENTAIPSVDPPKKEDQEDIRSYLSQIRSVETSSKVEEPAEDRFSGGQESGRDTETNRPEPAEREPAVPEDKPALDIRDIKIIDTVFDTYILAKDNDNFYMIDQHAAHERIFFEKFMKEYQNADKAIQKVMVPIMLDIPASMRNIGAPVTEALEKIGYEAEEFGPVTYRITGIPAFMDLDEAERLVRDFIDESPEADWYHNEEQFLKIATRACKSAIKAHDRTTREERQQLLSDLSACDNPYSCPHGRPTFIKMSQYQIEKLFKRV